VARPRPRKAANGPYRGALISTIRSRSVIFRRLFPLSWPNRRSLASSLTHPTRSVKTTPLASNNLGSASG